MLWRVAAVASLLLAAPFVAPPGLAQGPRSAPTGLWEIQDSFSVGAGEWIAVEPGTRVYGSGEIHVWGNLTVKGTSNATASFAVPIVLHPGSVLVAENARFYAVNRTALVVEGASAELADVVFEANNRALLASGPSRVTVRGATFRDHAGEAVYVEGASDVLVERARFVDNGRGLTVYSASRFQLNDSEFSQNGQHLVVDLGPWSARGEIGLARDAFEATSPTAAQLPGILLRHDTPLVDQSAQRTVRLDSNRIEGAPVGVRAEGRGLVVESRNDTFVDNAVGLSVQLATVRVEGGTFGNERDVEGSGRVTLDGVTYLRADGEGAALPTTPSWLAWALVGGVALLAGAALLLPRLRARAPVRSIVPVAPEETPSAPEPTPPPAPGPDVGILTSVERRILEDILAHPGTPQRAVADRLGTTRQALHYHVKKLEARGLVAKSVEGRETRCTVPPAVAEALVATAATRTGSEEKA